MKKRENIRNVPNSITSIRVILTIAIVFLYFTGISILKILLVFVIAALTDFFDGVMARKLKQETLFGARFDILADRFLWVTFGIILIFGYTNQGYYDIMNFLFIFSREILSTIFLVFYIIFSKERRIIPYVRYSGKLVTVVQSITIPAMILSDYYPFFGFYESLVSICGLFGVIGFLYYAIDLTLYRKYKKHRLMKWYDFINPIAPVPYQS